MFDFDGAVLLPIDMQKALDWPGRPRRGNPKLDENGLKLLELWRRLGLPIVHVRHDSEDEESLWHPGHPANAMRPGFEWAMHERIVVKSVNSAFIGTDLDLKLRRMKAKKIVCFGWSTDMCVSTTVRTGANMGWETILVHDACDCSDLPDPVNGGTLAAEEIHRIHVATLAAEFCEIVATADLAGAR